MRIGIVTPVLTRVAKSHAKWEIDAGIEDVARIARAADELGYDYLTCSEHVGIPTDVAPVRGATYWDPAATLGYLAAVTGHVRLATNVIVLGYHHPLEVVKTYGTLDRISGGRVILGVGVGSLQPEFELLEVPFDDRGPRADDAMRAIRASLAKPEPSYDGPYYRFGGMIIDPCAVQAGFDLALSPDRALDPGGGTERVLDTIGQMESIGTTVINARIVGHSLDHYVEQLEALAAVAGLGGSR